MVKTTGGPALGASVVSPAMTSGAVSLLDGHLTGEEKELWTSLGPNWTSPWSVSLCMRVKLRLRVLCHSNKMPSFPAPNSACLSLHTHLSSWTGGSLRSTAPLASLWKIPSSRSTNKTRSGTAGRHKLYRIKLDRQQARVKVVKKCTFVK